MMRRSTALCWSAAVAAAVVLLLGLTTTLKPSSLSLSSSPFWNRPKKKGGRELGWRWEVGDGGKGHTRFIVDRCFSQKHTLSNMYFPFRHDVNAKEVQHKPCFLLSYLLTFVGMYISFSFVLRLFCICNAIIWSNHLRLLGFLVVGLGAFLFWVCVNWSRKCIQWCDGESSCHFERTRMS